MGCSYATHFQVVFIIYQKIVKSVTETAAEIFLIVLYYILNTEVIGEPFLDSVPEADNVTEIAGYVAFTHNKADVFYLRQVVGVKAVLPVKGNITALDYEILFVLNGSLYHLFQDIPEVCRQLVVVIGRELGLTTSYKPHFQVVDRQVGVFVFFKQFLREQRFSCV